jgi:transposase
VGDVSAIGSADQLAAYAGLMPAAYDSGKRVGNHRKGRGGNKVLRRDFYQSAFSSMRAVPESRAEGKRHTQAGEAGEEEGERPVGDAARRSHVRGPVRSLTFS